MKRWTKTNINGAENLSWNFQRMAQDVWRRLYAGNPNMTQQEIEEAIETFGLDIIEKQGNGYLKLNIPQKTPKTELPKKEAIKPVPSNLQLSLFS